LLLKFLLIFSPLLLTGCGEEVATNKNISRLLNKEVISKPNDVVIPDFVNQFIDEDIAEESTDVSDNEVLPAEDTSEQILEAAKSIDEPTQWAIEAYGALENRETEPQYLGNAIALMQKLRDYYPEKTEAECDKVTYIEPRRHIETEDEWKVREKKRWKEIYRSVCNKKASAQAKIAEIYYYLGEGDPGNALSHFKHGEAAGERALTYNPHTNAETQHWVASNIGSRLSAETSDWGLLKKGWNKGPIQESMDQTNTGYRHAIKIDPEFRNGETHMALGRLNHETVTDKDAMEHLNLPYISKGSASHYFATSVNLSPDNPKYLYYYMRFALYLGDGENARNLANRIIPTASEESYSSQFPTSSIMYLREASQHADFN